MPGYAAQRPLGYRRCRASPAARARETGLPGQAGRIDGYLPGYVRHQFRAQFAHALFRPHKRALTERPSLKEPEHGTEPAVSRYAEQCLGLGNRGDSPWAVWVNACPSRGRGNQAGAKFCSECGAAPPRRGGSLGRQEPAPPVQLESLVLWLPAADCRAGSLTPSVPAERRGRRVRLPGAGGRWRGRATSRRSCGAGWPGRWCCRSRGWGWQERSTGRGRCPAEPPARSNTPYPPTGPAG